MSLYGVNGEEMIEVPKWFSPATQSAHDPLVR
jgi:hypothetical protein